MSDLVIKQYKFYNLPDCRDAIKSIEDRYEYVDETDSFGKLVNFSTAKGEPYQRWVRYREGYSTSLVNNLIERAHINPKMYYIADPMVGSGSTLISAVKNGFDSFGVDINPFSQLIVSTKMLSPAENDFADVEAFLNKLPEKYNLTDIEKPPLSEYFPEENLINLLELKNTIDEVGNPVSKQILTAGWFFILESCPNKKKDGNGLATRPAPVTDVISHFKEVIAEILTDYSRFPFGKNICTDVLTASALNFSEHCQLFEQKCKKKLGAIIFSPPYANAFDYYESYKMELLFGRLYDMEDYQAHKKEQIRNYRISYGRDIQCDYPTVELLCKAINTAVPHKEAVTGKKDARTRLMPNMLRGYFTDMGQVLEELYKALSNGGWCYIVVDQSSYVGVIIPTDVILARIAETIGFKVDSISICRKASTSAQQRKTYPYLGNTLRESIVCLRKE